MDQNPFILIINCNQLKKKKRMNNRQIQQSNKSFYSSQFQFNLEESIYNVDMYQMSSSSYIQFQNSQQLLSDKFLRQHKTQNGQYIIKLNVSSYLLTQKIESKSFSKVYKCMQIEQKQQKQNNMFRISIKQLQIDDQEKIQNLHKSVQNIKLINHKNLVTIIDYKIIHFHNKWLLIIILPLAQQHLNYKEFISNLSFKNKIQYTLSIIEALKYLNERNIIYKNVHTKNLLVIKQQNNYIVKYKFWDQNNLIGSEIGMISKEEQQLQLNELIKIIFIENIKVDEMYYQIYQKMMKQYEINRQYCINLKNISYGLQFLGVQLIIQERNSYLKYNCICFKEKILEIYQEYFQIVLKNKYYYQQCNPTNQELLIQSYYQHSHIILFYSLNYKQQLALTLQKFNKCSSKKNIIIICINPKLSCLIEKSNHKIIMINPKLEYNSKYLLEVSTILLNNLQQDYFGLSEKIYQYCLVSKNFQYHSQQNIQNSFKFSQHSDIQFPTCLSEIHIQNKIPELLESQIILIQKQGIYKESTLARCIQGRDAFQICYQLNCFNQVFLCDDKNCKCNKIHEECSILNYKDLKNELQLGMNDREKSLQNLENNVRDLELRINSLYDQIIVIKNKVQKLKIQKDKINSFINSNSFQNLNGNLISFFIRDFEQVQSYPIFLSTNQHDQIINNINQYALQLQFLIKKSYQTSSQSIQLSDNNNQPIQYSNILLTESIRQSSMENHCKQINAISLDNLKSNILICNSDNCNQKVVICGNKDCFCEKNHKDCQKVKWDEISMKLWNKLNIQIQQKVYQKIKNILNGIIKWYYKGIKSLKEEKKLLGLNNIEKQLYYKIMKSQLLYLNRQTIKQFINLSNNQNNFMQLYNKILLKSDNQYKINLYIKFDQSTPIIKQDWNTYYGLKICNSILQYQIS